jgi:hypothetical protein
MTLVWQIHIKPIQPFCGVYIKPPFETHGNKFLFLFQNFLVIYFYSGSQLSMDCLLPSSFSIKLKV